MVVGLNLTKEQDGQQLSGNYIYEFRGTFEHLEKCLERGKCVYIFVDLERTLNNEY